MAFRKRERHLPEIPIIPMIDTMFFLLVFFILTSLNVIKLEGINVNLPDAKFPNKTDTRTTLTVSINGKQQVYVNDKNVTGKDIGPILLASIKKQAGNNVDLSKQSIVINADGSVPHRLVVQCIDQARGVRLTKFAIATTSEDAKPATVTTP
ncbi:MAG: biopolymer transporter ExbD [Cytophagales bacterium]|nr:biopolymer transporter ExbD [Armatimonadota bacterium]